MGANYAGSFSIGISNDNTNWTTISSFTSGHQGINMIAGLSGRGRYVRITITSGPGSNYQLNDMSIFGD